MLEYSLKLVEELFSFLEVEKMHSVTIDGTQSNSLDKKKPPNGTSLFQSIRS